MKSIMENNKKVQKLLDRYFEVNDGISVEEPELFDWNLYDIQGYNECLEEFQVPDFGMEDEFTDAEVEHLKNRVEAMELLWKALQLLDKYGHVYA